MLPSPGRAWLPLLAAAALAGVFNLFTLRPGHSWQDDAFMYLMHADNLAAGRAYADTCYVYNPANPYVGPREYPPGYPALILAVKKLGGGIDTLKAVNAVSVSGIALASGLLAYGSAGPLAGIAAAALAGFAPAFWDRKDAVYSDIVFTLLACLAMLAWRLGTSRRGEALPRLAWFTAYLAYAVRPLGGLLPAAFLLEGATGGARPGPRESALRAACFAAPALLQAAFFPPFAYAGHAAGPLREPLLTGAARVLSSFFGSLADFWALGPAPFFPVTLAALLLAAALLALYAAGVWRRFRGGRPGADDYFVPLYAAAVAYFGMYDGVRFVFPVMPFVLWRALESAVSLKRGASAVPAAVCALAAGLAARSFLIAADYGPVKDGPYSAEAAGLFAHISAAAGPDDTVVFVKPRALCYFTGRKSSVYPPLGDDEAFRDYFAGIGADYLVVSRDFAQDAGSLYGFVRRNGDRLEKTWENGAFKVFRLRYPPGR